MYIKNNFIVKLTTGIFMIIMAGILYASVYYHFLQQTDGGFALGIYVGGLLLLLLLVMLTLKLSAFKKQEKHDVFIILEIIAVILLMVHGVFLRTLPEVIFNSKNTAYFDIAASLQNGIKMPNMDIVIKSVLDMPETFGYGKVMSYGFALFGRKPEVLYYAGLVLQMFSIFMIYRITRRIAGKQGGIVALLLCVYLPSQIFSVYTLNNEALFSCLFFGALWLFLYLEDIYRKREFDLKGMLCQIALGLLLAMMIFTEPVSAILAVIILLLQYFCRNRGIKRGLITTLTAVAVFALLLLWVSGSLLIGYDQVAYAYAKEFVPDFNVIRSGGFWPQVESVLKQFGSILANQGNDITENYESLLYMDGMRLSAAFAGLLQAVNQFIYLWTVLLSLMFGPYLLAGKNIRTKDRDAVLPEWLCIGAAVMLFLKMDGSNTAFYIGLLIILSCLALKYAYLGFAASDMLEAEEEEVIMRQKKLSKKEKKKELVKEELQIEPEPEQQPIIISEPEQPPIQYIENPLPLPKKHVKKNHIDYALEPMDHQMQYDIEVPEDADWDYK